MKINGDLANSRYLLGSIRAAASAGRPEASAAPTSGADKGTVMP